MRFVKRLATASLVLTLLAMTGAKTAAQLESVTLARQLLDDQLPVKKRQALINDHPQLAVELLAALVADLQPGSKEEYRRIPWVWRVTVAAGKRNDTREVRRLLELSLPKAGEPLRDWQAVVVGGGIINGISLQNVWPRPRLEAIMKGDQALLERWQKALSQAAALADNEKVPTGTRYDALRVIALDSWERRGPQLTKYLAKGTHDELQMGAVSGLADLDAPQVAPLLLAGLAHFSPRNCNLALHGLLRNDARTAALLAALEQGRIQRSLLADDHVKALRTLKNDSLRARALKLLAP